MRARHLIIPAMLAILLADAHAGTSTITLHVDLRDAPRKLLHAIETIPVQPGPLTLAYPKWLPAEHEPGPLQQHTGIFITAQGQTLRWQRDVHDAYLYHLEVPAGVSSIEIRSDFITSDAPTEGGGSASDNIAVLSWNSVLLYPYQNEVTQVSNIEVAPSLTLPPLWRHASSLDTITTATTPDGSIRFQPVTLDRLVDSPLIAGRYFRQVPLATELTPPHYLDMVAETPADLEITAAHVEALSRLVRQSGLLFGYRHYDAYRVLLTLSDRISGRAVDHHQSLDNRRPAKFMTDEKMLTRYASFIPHDLVHSWNGKYRRPIGLSSPNFQQPLDGSQQWIVEGLADYYGAVLAARSGMWKPEQFRGVLAENAAAVEHRKGRQWRDLEDSGRMAMTLWANQDQAYDNWRRSAFDFYGEGALVWLDIDIALRQASAGKKSLDDFAALFFGGGANTGPIARPYGMDEVITTLNQLVPLDWTAFLRERVQSLSPTPILSGISGAGYRLVYREQPTDWSVSNNRTGFEYAIGAVINSRGAIIDVLMNSAASAAGLVPGSTIATVQGQPYSTSLLQQAIAEAKTSSEPIRLVLQDGRSASLAYHGGQRYPALQAMTGQADLLSDIIRPR